LAFQGGTIMLAEELRELIAEISSFEAYPSKYGGWHYHGPGGHSDDLVMALLMAYDAIDRGRVGVSQTTGAYTRT